MGTSPTLQKTKVDVVEQMNFSKAVHRLLEGKHLNKVSWSNPNLYMFLNDNDGLLKLHKENGEVTDLVLHKHDFEDTDWIVV